MENTKKMKKKWKIRKNENDRKKKYKNRKILKK